MDSPSDSHSARTPVFTAWTLGYRRYYSPMVHALAGRTPGAGVASPFAGGRDGRLAGGDFGAGGKGRRRLQ